MLSDNKGYWYPFLPKSCVEGALHICMLYCRVLYCSVRYTVVYCWLVVTLALLPISYNFSQ